MAGAVAIVDDDEPERELLRKSVPKAKTFNDVLEFKSEKEFSEFLDGLNRKRSKLPVLFVIDLGLEKPDSGHRLLTKIRKTKAIEHIPVIICSSSEREKDIVTAYRAGANSYVAKAKKKEMAKQFQKMFSYWDKVAELP